MTSNFLSQFNTIFTSSSFPQDIIACYIEMDSTIEQFSDHINVILSDLRINAVEAIGNSDPSLHNMCLYRLSILVSFPEVCSVLVKTQRIITENLNSNTLVRASVMTTFHLSSTSILPILRLAFISSSQIFRLLLELIACDRNISH